MRLGQSGLLESAKLRFAMIDAFRCLVAEIRRPVGRELCSHRLLGLRYRNMENLPANRNASKKSFADMTVGELLRAASSPFLPVEVLRLLGPYGRMLELEPGIPKAPDPEFLVRLVTGHASHQAGLRKEAGNHYKNLENLIRGKHKVSPTTKVVLAGALGISMDDLENLEGSSPDGPLVPLILTIFQAVEGLPMRLTSGVLDREVPCPCCGHNLLDDVGSWWSKHSPGLRQAEYLFVERLLNAVLGSGLIERIIACLLDRKALDLDRLCCLSNPARHPIGNWLSEAQEAMSCQSLAELATAMQLHGRIGASFTHGRLKKWSSGQDAMPLEAGETIAEACGQKTSGVRRLIAARTIALVTEFVAASVPEGGPAVGRCAAQKIVHSRLEQLGGNLRLAINAIDGKLPQRASSSENLGN